MLEDFGIFDQHKSQLIQVLPRYEVSDYTWRDAPNGMVLQFLSKIYILNKTQHNYSHTNCWEQKENDLMGNTKFRKTVSSEKSVNNFRNSLN